MSSQQAARSSGPQADRPSKPPPSIATIVGGVAFVAITLWAGLGVKFTLRPLIDDLTRGQDVIAQFFDPNWQILTRPAVSKAFIETFQIAIISSLVGCLLALLLAMLASRVSAPNGVVYQVMKNVLSLVRSLPDIAYGLLFVAFVGVGALAGVLALIIFNIGVAAKLTAESIDAVDRGPIEAIEAGGGTRFQRGRFAILPQVAPNYLSYCFYVFELNIRASVVIGIVGGGGVGQLIYLLLSRLQFGSLSAIVVVVFVIVFVLDRLSRVLRQRLT